MAEPPTDPPAGDESDNTRSMAQATGATPAASAFPARVGRNTIRGVLGEGGMGIVYEAEQDQPRRVVALKVIRAGSLSPQLLRRFEHESQVLGRLQHLGIAHVYEAGTIEDARGNPVPFFAMELIRGVPLTTYAARKKLGTRERLDLIARICDAADHAHQKGVIHRDLKPGNILVDESGQPKILDFGIARAMDSDMRLTTLHTDIGQLMGTVQYMSPEQVSGDPDELDTRSDVYALGVVTYEAGPRPRHVLAASSAPRAWHGSLRASLDRTVRLAIIKALPPRSFAERPRAGLFFLGGEVAP
jgi:serine/threonine protein kinase